MFLDDYCAAITLFLSDSVRPPLIFID